MGTETREHAREHDLIGIQCLRGVAATMIVLFHAIGHADQMRDPEGPVRVLQAGVDIFFAISGFVMLTSVSRSRPGPGAFLINRLIRIAPMYWLITLAVVAIAIAMPQAMQSGKLQAGHAIASFLFFPVRHPVSGLYEPALIPGWTLNYEMFFYVLFAAGIWVARGRMAVLCWGVAAAIAVLVAIGKIAHPVDLPAFYTAGIILEFAYGLVIGWGFLRGWRLPAWLGLIAIAIGVAELAATAIVAVDVPREVAYGIPAALIVAGALSLPLRPGTPGIGAVRIVGDASYSLYLIHPLIVSAFGQAWRKLGLERLPGGQLLFVVAATSLCIAVAFMLYRFVEQPIIEYFKRRRVELSET